MEDTTKSDTSPAGATAKRDLNGAAETARSDDRLVGRLASGSET